MSWSLSLSICFALETLTPLFRARNRQRRRMRKLGVTAPDRIAAAFTASSDSSFYHQHRLLLVNARPRAPHPSSHLSRPLIPNSRSIVFQQTICILYRKEARATAFSEPRVYGLVSFCSVQKRSQSHSLLRAKQLDPDP